MLRTVDWELFTDVSRLHVDPIFKVFYIAGLNIEDGA